MVPQRPEHGVVRMLEHEFEAVHLEFYWPNPLFSRTLLEMLATTRAAYCWSVTELSHSRSNQGIECNLFAIGVQRQYPTPSRGTWLSS